MIRCASIFAFFAVSGCMTYTTTMYSTTNEERSAPREKKQIAYTFLRTSRVSSNASFDKTNCSDSLKGAWAAPQPENIALDQFRSAFAKDALAISPLVTKGGDSEIRMEIMQQNSWNAWGLLGAAVSGFTWTIIPCWGDDVYTLYAEVADNHGLEKTYQLSSSVTTVTWAPFILALPFTELPNKRVDRIARQHWDELLKRMRQDGFFAVAGNEGCGKRNTNRDSLEELRKSGLMSETEYRKGIGNIDGL